MVKKDAPSAISACWRWTRTILIGFYAYLAVATFYQDLTMRSDVDGTPMMVTVVFFLWPTAVLVIWSLTGDLRALRSGAEDRVVRQARVSLAVIALLTLSAQAAFWAVGHVLG